MKLPESVKIGPHDIQIAEGPESMDHFGQYTYDPPVIIIREGGSHSQRADTLLHEILHVIWKDSQVVKLMELKDLEDREEAMIRVIATQLTDILRDNAKVTKFIAEGK